MSLPDLLLRVLFWGAIYLGAARIGAWITRSDLRGIAHLAWDGLAGFPLVIAGWLVVGLVRFDRTTVLLVGAGALALASYAAIHQGVQRFERPAASSAGRRMALIVLISVVAFGLLWDRVPVLFFDSLAYHHAQPELWLLESRIAPYEWSLHSWFPPGMSVLYGVGLALGGEAWANDANLLLFVALGLAVFDLGRRLWNPRAGAFALAALVAVPQIVYALMIPAADLAHGTFVFASIAALVVSGGRSAGGWRRRAAWIAGGALLTKYLGLLVPLAAGAMFLAFVAYRTRGWGASWRVLLAFCLPGLVLLAPWFVANTWTVGNPVAPVLSDWIPTSGLAEGGQEAFHRDARGGAPGLEDLSALGPRLFGSIQAGIYPTPAWGWPVILWILVSLWGASRDPSVRLAFLLASGLFVTWFFTFRWERFLIAATCLLCLAFAGTVMHVSRSVRPVLLVGSLALVLGLSFAPLHVRTVLDFTGASWATALGDSPDEFLRDSWEQGRLLEHSGVTWDRDSHRILMLGETRHYRLPAPRVAPGVFNTHPLTAALDAATDVGETHRILRREGFTHLLVDRMWVTRSFEQYPSLRPLFASPGRFDGFIDGLGAPLVSGPRAALYRIPETP